MPKNAISVTLDVENLMWLKARTGSGQARSVSDLLDRIVTEARTGGTAGGVKSVVGTIDVDPADPLLLKADDAIEAMFTPSLGRPLVVKGTIADRKGPRRSAKGPRRSEQGPRRSAKGSRRARG